MTSRSEAPSPDRRHAIARGVGLLLVQRGIAVAGGVLFAAVVPRVMGPETYGRYALMTSVAAWLVFMGGLGMTNVIVRYVPGLVVREPAQAVVLLGNLFVLRLASGMVAAAVYLAVTLTWWRDLAIGALLLLTGSILAQAVATFVFATFLGFNRPERWAAADGIRRWVSLALIVPGFAIGGLTGACAAVLIGDVVLLAIGGWWARPWLARLGFHLDLRALKPYLGLGLAFYATQLLFAILCASGEPLVRIMAGDYAEVSYFALAHVMYLAGVAAVSHVTLPFVPLLSDCLARREGAAGQRWVERLLTWLMAASVAGVLASLLLGDVVVRSMLGPGFVPVAANLVPLSVALLLAAFGSVASTLALVHEHPRPILLAACVRLLTFWAVGLPLVADHGAWGASVAVAIAAAAHVLWLGWSLRPVLAGALRAPLLSLLLGAPCIAAVGLLTPVVPDPLLFVGLTTAYGAVLFGAGILKRAELASLIAALRARPADVPARGAGAPALP